VQLTLLNGVICHEIVCPVVSVFLVFSLSEPLSQAASTGHSQNNQKVKPTNLKGLTTSKGKAKRRLALGGPDLIVSHLEFFNREVRFRIKNIGRTTKKPGRLGYRLTVQRLN